MTVVLAVAVPSAARGGRLPAARRPPPPGVARADQGGGDHRAGDRHRVVPLVAGVLGLFGFIRGLGG